MARTFKAKRRGPTAIPYHRSNGKAFLGTSGVLGWDMLSRVALASAMILAMAAAGPVEASLRTKDDIRASDATGPQPAERWKLAQTAPTTGNGNAVTGQPATSLQVTPSQSAPAQTAQVTSQGDGVDGGGSPAAPTDLNWLITNKIRKDILATVSECSQYDERYRIDCLSQNLDHMARSLPEIGDYRSVRQILLTASGRLGSIVNRYADPAEPRISPRSRANPRFLKRRSYRAIAAGQLDRALREAQSVIDEAATQLLRSSENSAARLSHYQSIATAVNSTKVLLRS